MLYLGLFARKICHVVHVLSILNFKTIGYMCYVFTEYFFYNVNSIEIENLSVYQNHPNSERKAHCKNHLG